jgi:hypothetical protein
MMLSTQTSAPSYSPVDLSVIIARRVDMKPPTKRATSSDEGGPDDRADAQGAGIRILEIDCRDADRKTERGQQQEDADGGQNARPDAAPGDPEGVVGPGREGRLPRVAAPLGGTTFVER